MKVLWAWGRNADGMHWSSVVLAIALLMPTVHAPPGLFG
jgi:hypothetical protein